MSARKIIASADVEFLHGVPVHPTLRGSDAIIDALAAAGYRIIGPDELVRVRSDAIREFCANAKIAPSVEADSLPNDVRQFRLEAAVDARRLIRSLKKEGGGG